MIDCISGKVVSCNAGVISVDIGSIALFVHVPDVAQFIMDQKVVLYAHMHWNQDQGPMLLGFSTELERSVFLLVIGCSGIGPKIGLAVLKDLGAERFLQAVQMDDEKALSSVNGLGPKKVEQMVVQLRRKVAKLIKSGVELEDSGALTDWQNVSDVLTSLNYSRTEVSRAMKHLSDKYSDSNLQFDGLVRRALSFLSKRG